MEALKITNEINAAQSINVCTALDSLCETIDKKVNVIEIGTSHGGFTLMLKNAFVNHGIEANIFTFDVTRHSHYCEEYFKKFDIKSYLIDCFSQEGMEIISSIINKPEKCILFCDGGNKPKEFNTFSKILKAGDIIFAHDYIETDELFNSEFKGKIWDWHETRYSDIKQSIEENGLFPYLEDKFKIAVWASFQKK